MCIGIHIEYNIYNIIYYVYCMSTTHWKSKENNKGQFHNTMQELECGRDLRAKAFNMNY